MPTNSLTSVKKGPRLVATIQCPSVSSLTMMGFKYCQRMTAERRRLIVMSSLFARLTDEHGIEPNQLANFLKAFRFNDKKWQVKIAMLLARKIWPNVISLSRIDDRHNDRYILRLQNRMPRWFFYGGCAQRHRDIRDVVRFCHRMGY